MLQAFRNVQNPISSFDAGKSLKNHGVMPTRIYQVFDAYLRIVPTITNTWRPTPIDNPQLKHITIFILQILLKKRRKGYFAWWRHSQGTFMDKELNMMVLQSVEIVGWIETCAVKDVAYYIKGDFNYTNVSSVASNETNEDLILQFWELAKVPTYHPWRENFQKHYDITSGRRKTDDRLVVALPSKENGNKIGVSTKPHCCNKLII